MNFMPGNHEQPAADLNMELLTQMTLAVNACFKSLHEVGYMSDPAAIMQAMQGNAMPVEQSPVTPPVDVPEPTPAPAAKPVLRVVSEQGDASDALQAARAQVAAHQNDYPLNHMAGFSGQEAGYENRAA